jgi:Electron transfer DM13
MTRTDRVARPPAHATDPGTLGLRRDGVELIGDVERAFAAAIYPNRYVIAAVAVAAVVLLVAIARRRGWDLVARRHPRATVAALAVALAVAAPVSWYLGSPPFLSSAVDEPAPVVAAAPSSIATASLAASATAIPSVSVSPTPALVSRSGTFRGADDFHFGGGTARLIETAPGTFTLRLESFEVRNGPDLYVYLSPSVSGYAKGAVELGRLKADRGNQNYAVPAGTNVTAARSVVIWCKQFSVLFATATLD